MNPPNNLTPVGQSWLTCALDPFHDYTQQVQGLPDSLCIPSYTRVHNQVVQVGATGLDQMILVKFNGLHSTAENDVSVASNNTFLSVMNCASNVPLVGPFQVIRANSGSYPAHGNIITGGAALVASLPLTPDLKTPSRIIAMGCEIVDTTQALYKAGSIGACHVPGAFQHDTGMFISARPNPSDSPWTTIGTHTVLTPPIPTDRTAASRVPGWVEWEASKGMYVVARMSEAQPPRHFFCTPSDSNPDTPSQNCVGVEVSGFRDGNEYRSIPHNASTIFGAANSADNWVKNLRPAFQSGFMPWTVFLSGISSAATFKITLRTVVEYFPEVSDIATIANAQICSPYDPNALIKYHQAASVLPVGVPVGMNAKGDWWRMVLKGLRIGANVASAALPVGLTAAGMPYASSIATIVGSAVNSALSRQGNQKKKRPAGAPKGAR